MISNYMKKRKGNLIQLINTFLMEKKIQCQVENMENLEVQAIHLVRKGEYRKQSYLSKIY